MFQHVAKKSFNIFALSLSLAANVSSEYCRGGMVSRFLFHRFPEGFGICICNVANKFLFTVV